MMGLHGDLKGVLSDGGWHTYGEIRNTVEPSIRPEIAIRMALRSGATGDIATVVARGRHRKIVQALCAIGAEHDPPGAYLPTTRVRLRQDK